MDGLFIFFLCLGSTTVKRTDYIWSVVELENNEKMQIIPNVWLIENNSQTVWPSFYSSSENLETLIRNKEEPGRDWSKRDVTKIYKSTSKMTYYFIITKRLLVLYDESSLFKYLFKLVFYSKYSDLRLRRCLDEEAENKEWQQSQRKMSK